MKISLNETTNLPKSLSPQLETYEQLLALIAQAKGYISKDNILADRFLSEALQLIANTRDPVDLQYATFKGLSSLQIARIDDYITSRLESPIRIQELSEITRLSCSHFTHVFKLTLGISPSVYITKKRIEAAREKLRTTDETLTKIAFDYGFCDQAHFCRTFRKVTGVAPKAWRRLHAGADETSSYISTRQDT
jgi:AraC-like DNA-binding protein